MGRKNKMTLNMLKTKEIVFHRPHPGKYSLPDVLCDIERVVSVKLLGVFYFECESLKSK